MTSIKSNGIQSNPIVKFLNSRRYDHHLSLVTNLVSSGHRGGTPRHALALVDPLLLNGSLILNGPTTAKYPVSYWRAWRARLLVGGLLLDHVDSVGRRRPRAVGVGHGGFALRYQPAQATLRGVGRDRYRIRVPHRSLRRRAWGRVWRPGPGPGRRGTGSTALPA